MDFAEPLKYPLQDLKKIIIGGLLLFPGIILLLIPAIIASGYTIKVAGDTVRNRDSLPEFDDWSYFLMKGIGSLAISVVYYTIIVVAFIPAVIFFILAIKSNVVFMIPSLILGLIAIIPAIILMFMAYVACVRYGEKENIGAAFSFGKIFRNFKANLVNYIIGFIILIGVSCIISIVIYPAEIIAIILAEMGISIALIILVMIPFVIIYAIGMFYYMVVSLRMFAQIYKETKEKLSESENLN